MKNNIQIKQNSKKQEAWDHLLSEFINNPFVDFSLEDGVSTLRIWVPGDSGWGLVLNKDGTWKLE
jgi:hypothetical protein